MAKDKKSMDPQKKDSASDTTGLLFNLCAAAGLFIAARSTHGLISILMWITFSLHTLGTAVGPAMRKKLFREGRINKYIVYKIGNLRSDNIGAESYLNQLNISTMDGPSFYAGATYALQQVNLVAERVREEHNIGN